MASFCSLSWTYSFDSLSQYENSEFKAAVLIPEIASSDGMEPAFLNTGISALMGSDMSATIGWDFRADSTKVLSSDYFVSASVEVSGLC